ncbi:autotransporter outer membrane beta-barrel domain-containing protein [Aeromonas hydrophila]|uniref:hypothetical protein n=1 Tax=Aeromonas hydrophila TaxID=644 RepID=UPI002B45BAA7|nr:hypothetical protein [Aeromonas hydrophila]
MKSGHVGRSNSTFKNLGLRNPDKKKPFKPTVLSATIAHCILPLVLISYSASATSAPPATQNKITVDTQKRLDVYSKSLQNILAGLKRYYSREKSWPARLDILSEKGYVSVPNFNGKPLIGGINGAGEFQITVNLLPGEGASVVAKQLAAKYKGKVVGDTLSLTLQPPVGFIDENLYVDRFNPKAMGTDFSLQGKWVKNANFSGSTIDVSQIQAGDLTAENAVLNRNLFVLGNGNFTDGATAITYYNNNVSAFGINSNANMNVGQKFTSNKSVFDRPSVFDGVNIFGGSVIANQNVGVKSLGVNGTAIFDSATFYSGFNATDIYAYGGLQGSNLLLNSALFSDKVNAGTVDVTGDVSVLKSVMAKNITAGDINAVNMELSGNLNTKGLVTKDAVTAINGLYVGTDNKLVADANGLLFDGGQALDKKYLGINAKATDSELLDGLTSKAITVLARDNTQTKLNRFNGQTQINNGLYSGNALVMDNVGGSWFESGVALKDKYLGLNAKAADSAALDGISAAGYAQLLGQNVFQARQQFNQGINVNADFLSSGVVIARSGNLYEGGTLLRDKYLSITGKAADSDKLDGIDSPSLARRDQNNLFQGATTFTNDVSVAGSALLGSVQNTANRTTGLEQRVSSTDQQLNNLLYVKSRCKVHAKDPGCQFVFIPKEVVTPTQAWFVGKSRDYGGNSGSGSGGSVMGWYPFWDSGSLTPSSFADVSLSMIAAPGGYNNPIVPGCGFSIDYYGGGMCVRASPNKPIKKLIILFNNNGQSYELPGNGGCLCRNPQHFSFLAGYNGPITVTTVR